MMNNKILREVVAAYGDAGGYSASKKRNLNFKASEFVTRDEAFAIMDKALPRGYNEFRAGLLNYFHIKQKFMIAREGSVCLYVWTPPDSDIIFPSMEELQADEMTRQEDGTMRIWWD